MSGSYHCGSYLFLCVNHKCLKQFFSEQSNFYCEQIYSCIKQSIESKLSEVKPEALASIKDELFSFDSFEWNINDYKNMKVELDDEVANLEDSITHFEIEKAK